MTFGTQQIAELLGVTRGYIAHLVRGGMPKLDRGKFDGPACVAWWVAFKNKDSAPEQSTDVNEARKKLYDAQVVKVELETTRIKRESIPADEFMIDMSQMAVIYSSGLDALEGRLPGVLLGVTDAGVMSEVIRTEANEIRTNVADAITSYSHTISNG